MLGNGLTANPVRAFWAWFFFAATSCLVVVLTAQTPAERSVSVLPGEQLLRQGELAWNRGQADSAYVLFRQAQALALADSSQETWASATWQAGLYQSRQLRLDQAEATLDSVVALAGVIDSLHPAIFFARRELANLSLRRGNTADAVAQYEALLNDTRRLQPGADSLLGMASDALAQGEFSLGNLPAAFEHATSAKQHYLAWNRPESPSLALAENTLGIITMYQGKTEEALAHFKEALSLLGDLRGTDHPDLIQIRSNVGVLYGEMGLYWEALAVHRDNEPFLAQLAPEPRINGLLNLGSSSLVVEEYEEAVRYFDEAEVLVKQFPGLGPDYAAYLAGQRSVALLNTGRPREALQATRRALALQPKTAAQTGASVSDYLQLGTIYQKLDKPDSATIAYKQALALSNKVFGSSSRRSAFALSALGELACGQGNMKAGVPLMDSAYRVFSRLNLNGEASQVKTTEAVLWRKAGHPDTALMAHQAAWAALLPDDKQTGPPDLSVSAHWREVELIDLLSEYGFTILALADSAAEQESCKTAMAYFEAAIAALDSQRVYFETSESRSNLIRNRAALFDGALHCTVVLGSEDPEGDWADRAWQLTDMVKANQLRDRLKGLEAFKVAGVPDSIQTKDRAFRQRIAALNNRMAVSDSMEADSLQQLISLQMSRYREFQEDVEDDYSEYFTLTTTPEKLSVGRLSWKLKSYQAVYAYYWGSEEVVITSMFRGDRLLKAVPRAAIDSLLYAWVAEISQAPGEDRVPDIGKAEIAFALRELLLPGFDEDMIDIIIAADGPLQALPFESLLSSLPADADLRTWPFLVRGHSFSYQPSLLVWLEKGRSEREYADYLGFAPSFEGEGNVAQRSGMHPLYYPMEEIQATAELLEGKVLAGSAATESALRQLSDDATILHFATHAVAEQSDLRKGRLYLSEEEGSDGVLYAGELYGMELNCPLAVLSACKTASGPYQRGEGVMSLARAFEYAGARRVIAGLWDMDDESAAQLSQGLFYQLRGGRSASRALRMSQARWLEQQPAYKCHPYYWSGMILIGHGGDLLLEVNRGLPWWEIFLVSLGLIFIWMWWWSYQAKNTTKVVG